MRSNIYKSLSILAFVILFSASVNNIYGQITINEVYGGGGNSGATFNADYVELFNNGDGDVNLTGYTIHYASASGSFSNSVALTGMIPAKGFFLVQTTNSGGTGAVLPTPNQTASSPNLSATNGNVLLTDGSFIPREKRQI